MQNARSVALRVLVEARKSGHDSSLLLHRALAESGFSGRDNGFATLLVMQTLRHLHVTDALLANCLREPIVESKAPYALMALRMGVVQLLWLETSAHAAVNETVELVKTSPNKALAGLVNAVLKRVAQEGNAMLAAIIFLAARKRSSRLPLASIRPTSDTGILASCAIFSTRLMVPTTSRIWALS